MVGDFLGRKDAFPFQTTASEVEKQDDFAVGCGEIVNALGHVVTSDRVKMRLVFDQQRSIYAVIGAVIIHEVSVFIVDGQFQLDFNGKTSIQKTLVHGIVVGGLAMPWAQVVMNSHGQSDDFVGQTL